MGPAGIVPGQGRPGDLGRARIAAAATAARTAAAGRPHLGSADSGTDPAGRADLGRAASASSCDGSASTARTRRRSARTAARSGQLGCDRRAARARVGCASSGCAWGAGTTGGLAATATTTRCHCRCRAPAARANLGLAPG